MSRFNMLEQHSSLNPQTDIEKLQLLVESDNPPTNLTLLRRWMSEATLPILKKYLNEFIFQQETGTTISIETYNEAKAEIAGMQFESGGTVGSVKDYWASIDLSKLPEAAQSFIKEQLMNPPAGFSSENETFMELQGIINNYLQKQQEPVVPEAIPFSEIPNQLEIKDPVEGQVLYADVNDKDVIRKQVIQAAKQAQKLVKKPLFVFEIPDGELTQIFFTSDGKHSPAEFIAMALPWVDKVYQDEHEEDEHEDITVLKNELQVLKSALPFVRGKDLKEIKSKIKSINSALEIIAPNQKFANGGRLDSKSFDITIGGVNYMGNYHWEGNEIIIDDCEREDPDLVEVQADYTFVPVNDEKTLQAVIEKLEVDKADEKMDEAEAAWEARYSMAADAYGFKKGGKVAIDEMSVLNRMSLGMIAEYSEKLSKIVTADLPAWALAKISKAEAMVAAIKHRLEAENPTLFAKGGELSNGEYAEIQLKHIHHYSKKMLNVLPEIKLEAWMGTNLFLAADYLDSIYHYLDKSKMAKGGGMGKIITFKDGFKFREVSYEYAKANWQKLNIYIVREDEQSESLVENEGDLNEDATYGIEIGFEKGGQVEAARIYAFLQDDLPKLSEAIRAGNNEEVERLFSYWNQHLPNLKTKKYNERMYNFLEDDLRKLYEAVGEGNMEEVDRFFSYWGTHLKALDTKGGVFEYNEGGKIISVPENLTDEDILKLAETTKSEINDDLSKLYPQRDFCGMAIKSGDKSKETRAKFDDLTNRILYIQNIEKSIDEIISKYKKSKGGGIEQSFKVGDSVVINDPKDPINGCSGKVVGFYGEGKQKHAEVKLTSVPPNSVFNKGDVELIRLKHLQVKKVAKAKESLALNKNTTAVVTASIPLLKNIKDGFPLNIGALTLSLGGRNFVLDATTTEYKNPKTKGKPFTFTSSLSVDLDTFEEGEEYNYQLTEADLESKNLKAELFCSDEDAGVEDAFDFDNAVISAIVHVSAINDSGNWVEAGKEFEIKGIGLET